MGVGDSFELIYRLPGQLPAGSYRLVARGYQPTQDAVLHGEVLHGPGTPDGGIGDGGLTLIVEARGSAPRGDAGAGLSIYLDETVSGAAVVVPCGELLYYRVTAESGASDFYEVFLELDVP